IEKMENDFQSSRKDIVAYVGPSIDQEHYEVGPEVYEVFEGFRSRDQFFQPKGKKYLLSMTDANLSILKDAGLRPGQIEVERTSTYTDPKLHSARLEGKEYQLNAMITLIPG